eukprot:4052840-Amphidinium_carterae.1
MDRTVAFTVPQAPRIGACPCRRELETYHSNVEQHMCCETFVMGIISGRSFVGTVHNKRLKHNSYKAFHNIRGAWNASNVTEQSHKS